MNIKKFTQKDRYGNSMSFEFEVPPMDQGVPVPPGHPGAMPVGTDTVPAMLTPGEFVMNAEATRMFKPQIEAMNNAGRVQQKSQGGPIPTNYLSGGGMPSAAQIDDETATFLRMMEELRQQQNKPSIMQGFIPGNEQIPQGQMVGSQGVQPVPQMPQLPVHQFQGIPEPVQATPGQESVMLVTQDGLPLNSNGQPFTDSKLTVPRNYDPSAPAQVGKEYSGRGQGYEMRDKIIETTLGHEGGKANDPVDKGGKTNFGITQTTYNNMGFKGDVNDLTREEAKEFYNKYWDSFKIDTYPPHLRDQIFDMYTNHSPRGVAKILQKAAGVEADGIIGPQTMAAIQNLDPNAVVEARKDYYETIMENDPSQEKFRNGWMNRAESFRKGGDEKPQVPRGDEAPPKISEDQLAKHMSNLDNGAGDGVSIPGISSANAAVDPEIQAALDAGDPIKAAEIAKRKAGMNVSTPPRHGPVGGVPSLPTEPPKPAGLDEPPVGTGVLTKENEAIDNQIKGLEKQLFDQKLADPNSSFVKDLEARIEKLKAQRDSNTKGVEDRMVFDKEQDRREAEQELRELQKAKDEMEKAGLDTTDIDKQIDEVSPKTTKVDVSKGGRGSEIEKIANSPVKPNETGPGEDQPGDTVTPETVTEEGEKTDPTTLEKIQGFIKGAFGDLFNGKELARMAIMYAGSRALGYSHGGSIRWAAKQYVSRVDAINSDHDKRVQQLVDSGDWTKESIAAYKKSKDINDLQKVGMTFTPTGESEYKLVTVKGKDGKYTQKRLKVRKMTGSDNGTYWQLPSGQNVDALLLDEDKPENVKGTDEYNAKNSRVRGDVLSTFKSELTLLDTENNRGNKEGQTPRPLGFTPETAAEDYVAFARELGLDPESPFVRTMATNALHNAYDDALKGTKGRSYGEYLHQMFIRETTGATDNLSLGVDKNGREQFVDAALIGVLNRDLVVTAKQKRREKGLPEVSDQELRQTMYNSAMAAWGELGDDAKKEWDRKATDGETTGFYEFMKAKLLDFKVS